jgi:predicted TIM-barrel fold metal-dependent hydrolase
VTDGGRPARDGGQRDGMAVVTDTHQHLGVSRGTGYETTEAALLAAMDREGIARALVMPQATLDAARAEHDRIAALARQEPDRVRGIASICPWVGEAAYWDEASRCVRELGFVALKLDPQGHGIAPTHPAATVVFEAARALRVPVIVHTGMGVPAALPSLCLPRARAYPDVPLVLAHAGWGVFGAEALVVAEAVANVWLEPSWCPVFQIREALRRLGPGRILFGSDHLENMAVQREAFRQAGVTAAQWRQIAETNPRELFGWPPVEAGA